MPLVVAVVFVLITIMSYVISVAWMQFSGDFVQIAINIDRPRSESAADRQEGLTQGINTHGN
jgi:hypothetical protein